VGERIVAEAEAEVEVEAEMGVRAVELMEREKNRVRPPNVEDGSWMGERRILE